MKVGELPQLLADNSDPGTSDEARPFLKSPRSVYL